MRQGYSVCHLRIFNKTVHPSLSYYQTALCHSPQEAERKKSDEEQKQKTLDAKREAESGPGRKLAEAIISRGIRVCRPQVRLESRCDISHNPEQIGFRMIQQLLFL